MTIAGRRRAALVLAAWTHPPCQAGQRAMQRAFGSEVLFTREGGSGPGGRPGRHPRRAAGVRGGRPGLRPDPRAEREGGDGAAAQGAQAAAYLWEELAAVAGRADGRPGERRLLRRRVATPRGPAGARAAGPLARGEVDRSGAPAQRREPGWPRRGPARRPGCWCATRPGPRRASAAARRRLVFVRPARRRTASGSCSASRPTASRTSASTARCPSQPPARRLRTVRQRQRPGRGPPGSPARGRAAARPTATPG